MLRRRMVGIVLILMLMVILTACSCNQTVQLAKPAMEEGAKPVEITGACEAELTNGGQALLVTGTSDIMNGTNGVFTVVGADGATIEEQKFKKESDDMSHEFQVGDNWPDVVYGFITFDTQQSDAQPVEVTDVYGKKFQNLEGDDIIWDLKGVMAVFQSEQVRLRG